MKVLIAEDDRISSMVLKKNLQKLGHEVYAASNGEEAWEYFQRNPVRLIITDWMMPLMDGLELCKKVRAHSSEYTYVILLTAKDRQEDRVAGLNNGADDFMIKPLDILDFEARLQVATRILHMQEELQGYVKMQAKMRDELESQNVQLVEAMTFLEGANHRFSELFMGLPIACYTYDSEGRVHDWNRACEKLYGIQAEQVFEKHVWEIMGHSEDNARIKEQIEQVFAGQRAEGMEIREVRPDGQVRHVLRNTFPLHGQNGDILGAISANMDITERKELEDKLEQQLSVARSLNAKLNRQRQELAKANAQLAQLVVTDGLTGLKNHRHFQEQLQNCFSFSRRHGFPFSVVMLDVDLFKSFNDTYGHPAGDEVLREVATLMQKQVRSHDVVARYGGEEFAILLLATDHEKSCEVAERLRQAIANSLWLRRQVTASFGVSTYTNEKESGSQLLEEADKALYRSKETGRNKVTHYDDVQEESNTVPLAISA
jgi:two-component system cell cycle response regulator